jgi:hypothetical protein
LQSYILSLHNKVETEDRLVGNMNPDSANNLPFGIVKEIGATRYIICVDSAQFLNNSAFMSAYMALEFPGSQQKICFSAQNIAFNPKGVMPGPNTKLVLVSEHRISLGPKVTMVLKPDGFNYVEWDCNGFSAVNLKGYFEFDPGMIYPDPDAFSPDSVAPAFRSTPTTFTISWCRLPLRLSAYAAWKECPFPLLMPQPISVNCRMRPTCCFRKATA